MPGPQLTAKSLSRSIRRGGIYPSRALPAAANGHGGQRAGRPTTPLKKPCVGRGALTPPKPTAKSLSRLFRGALSRGGQRAGRPTTPLKIRAQGKILPPTAGRRGRRPLRSLPQTCRRIPSRTPPFCIFFTNFTVLTQNRGHLCKTFTAIVPHHGRYPPGNAVQWPCFR